MPHLAIVPQSVEKLLARIEKSDPECYEALMRASDKILENPDKGSTIKGIRRWPTLVGRRFLKAFGDLLENSDRARAFTLRPKKEGPQRRPESQSFVVWVYCIGFSADLPDDVELDSEMLAEIRAGTPVVTFLSCGVVYGSGTVRVFP